MPSIGLPLEPTLAQQNAGAGQLRERIFEALHTYFDRLSSWLPVVVLFKEMQWIDGSSRQFLEDLMRRRPARPVFVLGAAAASGSDDRLAPLRGFGSDTRLHLGPLELNVVSQLSGTLLKGRFTARENHLEMRTFEEDLYPADVQAMVEETPLEPSLDSFDGAP